ncbi:MAG: YcxB family protein [Oscillospiraceae bacterium]|nr:YcxB family protein [Oscillospiraceae bacterium]
MEPLFRIEAVENRKMWYEDYYCYFQQRLLKTVHHVGACLLGLCIIFNICSWIKEGQIVLTHGDIVVAIIFVYTLTYDHLAAFLLSLNVQRYTRKRLGLPYVPTIELFYDEYMEWSNTRERDTVSYSEITDIQTTKNMFVFITPKCRYLVPKSGFTLGTPQDFEKFIASKITR